MSSSSTAFGGNHPFEELSPGAAFEGVTFKPAAEEMARAADKAAEIKLCPETASEAHAQEALKLKDVQPWADQPLDVQPMDVQPMDVQPSKEAASEEEKKTIPAPRFRLRADAPAFVPTLLLPKKVDDSLNSSTCPAFTFQTPSDVGAPAKAAPEEAVASSSSLVAVEEDPYSSVATATDVSSVYPRTNKGSGRQRLFSDDGYFVSPRTPNTPTSGFSTPKTPISDANRIEFFLSDEMKIGLAGGRPDPNHKLEPGHFDKACKKYLNWFKNKVRKPLQEGKKIPRFDNEDLVKDFYYESERKSGFLRIVVRQSFDNPAKLAVITCFYVDYSQGIKRFGNESNFLAKLKNNEIAVL